MDSTEASFSQEVLRGFLAGEHGLDAALERLANIALEELAPVDAVSISLLRGGQPETPVFTDKTAYALDETQYRGADGPCLSAMRHSGIEEFEVGTDERWPWFAQAAADNGIRGVLSVALVGDDDSVVGALNSYSRTDARLDRATRDHAVRLAAVGGIAVANAMRFDSVATLALQLQQAIESRGVIEQAKGIVMAARRCSPEAAFEVLRRASQHQNRKLREIAAEVVASVQVP